MTSLVNVRAVTSTSSIVKRLYIESCSASLYAKTECAHSARNGMKNIFFVIVRPIPGGLINLRKE